MTSPWEQWLEQEKPFECQAVIDAALKGVAKPKLLEAGCGSSSNLRFPPNSDIIGIDISPEQLEHNTRLSEKILGDIETYDLSHLQCQVVVCSFVLEHLERPGQAALNLFRALAPGGILIFIAPSLFSLVGLITKLTPYWMHVYLYRDVLKLDGAGQKGLWPFRTPMRIAMCPSRIKSLAVRNGLEVVYFKAYHDYISWKLASQHRLVKYLLGAVSFICRILSLGKATGLCSTYCIVLRKKPTW